MQDNQKLGFNLGVLVEDLALDEDASSNDLSLEGLQEELEECKNDDEVANILAKGTKLREYAKGVENSVRQVELDTIQDYIKESDNLVLLHGQIRDCDSILSEMETILGGFQAEIGSISSEIKNLQEKSMDMGLKLKNRKVAESKLTKFVEDIIVPPRMIDIIFDGEVNDEYLRTLEMLSKKLKFVDVDPMVKSSKTLKDVQPELERLRQKAISKEIDQPALIPHIAEANSQKYPYEVLFRSLHKLLVDTATSEYLFCDDFFGEESIFNEIFAGPFAVIDEHINTVLPNCYDAIGLMLMIRIIHQHQLIMFRRRVPCLDSYLDKVNISLWPRFKMVFDMHLNSLRNANVKTLWEDDAHPHYVMRRYAEFTASLVHLNVEYGDGQLDLNLERLRMAVDDLLFKLAKTFTKPKLQTVFLINNYDITIAILKEAGAESGKMQMHFEDLLNSNIALFVEELLVEHFSELIKFVKTRASKESSWSTDVEALVKDFASRWKGAIEVMHKDVITSFNNFLCGMEILKAALTQLLLYYTRFSECAKRIPAASTLNKDLVSISSILHEIKKYSRTF